MGGLYGKVLPEVFRTDRATKERGLCDKKPKAILSRTDRANEVNKGFIIWLWIAICCDFVEDQKLSLPYSFSLIYLGHLFVQDSKTRSESDFRRHYTA